MYVFDWRRYLFFRSCPPQTDEPHNVDYVEGAVMLFNTRAFRQVGGFDQRYFLYAEDSDICLRMKRAGFECLRVPNARVWHQAHGSAAAQSALAFYHKLRSSFYFAERFACGSSGNRIWLNLLYESCRKSSHSARLLRATLRAVADYFLGRRGRGPLWLYGKAQKRT